MEEVKQTEVVVQETLEVPVKPATKVGVINIIVFDDQPCNITFSGDLKGRHITWVLRAIIKQYKVWKSTKRK